MVDFALGPIVLKKSENAANAKFAQELARF
jgi:hypothetical protein